MNNTRYELTSSCSTSFFTSQNNYVLVNNRVDAPNHVPFGVYKVAGWSNQDNLVRIHYGTKRVWIDGIYCRNII